MKFLVTGGSGFIGGRFVERALARGDSVIDVDCLTYAADRTRHTGVGYVRVNCDVAGDYGPLLPDLAGVDTIVHFAAETHVDNSLTGPGRAVRTNVIGTLNILALARKIGARFVHVSTDEVTGDIGFDAPPANEESPIRASSPYSASKAAAELLVRAYVRSYDLDAVVVRPVNTYGPYQHPEKFIPRAITYALSGKPIPLFTPGTQMREWIYVDDVVRGIEAAIEHGKKGDVYCLGSGVRVVNGQLAKHIAGLLGAKVEQVPDRPGHDVRYATDSFKALRDLEWKCAAVWPNALEATVAWYKTHVPWWRRMIEQGGKWT